MKMLLSAAAVLAASVVGASAATILTQGSSEAVGAQVFAENTATVGAGDVTVDYLVGSNLDAGDSFRGVNQFSGGVSLDAGTYASYLIHYDPLNSNGGSASGSYTFDGDIVAVIVSNGAGRGNTADGTTDQLLNLSDAVFGNATYEQSISRRSEGHDVFELVSANTLAFDFGTSRGFIDNVRVITAAPVPIPASLPLLLAGLGGMAYLRRRAS